MAALIKFVLTMELLLLSTGLISSFIMLKKTVSPRYLFDMVHVNLSNILNYSKSFLSSPFYICVFINSVVILILTFSKFHNPIKKLLNVFLDEKYSDDDIQIQPQAHHEIKEDYMPNRTNSAIAMDIIMSFFNRNYNSHPPVLEDIQDEMLFSSVKDTKIDSAQTTTTLPQSQTSWDRLRAKIDSAQTTTTLSQSQTSRDRLRAQSCSAQTSHNFLDISHLTEAREIISPRSSNPSHDETSTRTNYQENDEELEELEDDSLEATWKAITKKKELRKSVTFNDALSMSRIGVLRGDISVSTEESNKKFDDFIKKINQERLLQRQESDQRAKIGHVN
ncbi:hypothetical protein K7X08_035057 [Anisodus acutangulus]|uniref:DUF4408 domain-containing protein n=1 Tax=Anisodus acutangulus TaxID=402998 RepID=A0A9Q1R204_9SOLA|nr:hypothetical protein K7X08_035057 [Anisodus acutangulus]